MLQHYWVRKAEMTWVQAWLLAPKACDQDEQLVNDPSTQSAMSAEVNWFERQPLIVLLTLGEGRDESGFDRVWFSELNLVYHFRVSVQDLRVEVYDFYDSRFSRRPIN
jgi:hypothetical protein